MRVFLALPLPPEIQSECDSLNKVLAEKVKRVKWVKKGNFHITLQFFGEIEAENLPNLEQRIASSLNGFTAIETFMERVGYFFTGSVPRVIWAGVRDEGEALSVIMAAVNQEFNSPRKLPQGKTIPHVTLGRFREGSAANRTYPKDIVFNTNRFLIKEAVMFRSILNPEGPAYLVLKKFPLR